MATAWVVTESAKEVALDAARSGELQFTVTNPGPVQDRAVLEMVPGEGVDRTWFEFAVEEPQRLLSPGASVPYLVKVSAAATAPAGSHAVQARVYSADTAPEESSALSNRVMLAVAGGQPSKPKPWWLLAVALLVVVVLVVVGVLIIRDGGTPPPAGGGATVIDFEDPPLAGADQQIIHPYSAEGVTFTVDSAAFPNAVVGLVKNRSATSACADPASDDQLLGTGLQGNPESVGRAAFQIRAEFAQPLQPVNGSVTVSVAFQSLAGSTVRLQLFDSGGNLVGENTALLQPPAGTCGNPGDPRARTTVTAQSSSPVALATMAEAAGGRVFVIDDFQFEAAG